MTGCDRCEGTRSCPRCRGTGGAPARDGRRCAGCVGSGKCPGCQTITLLDVLNRSAMRRTALHGAPAGAWSQGLVAQDLHLHAINTAAARDEAVCGGGPIRTRVAGCFEPDVPGTCPRCGDRVAGR